MTTENQVSIDAVFPYVSLSITSLTSDTVILSVPQSLQSKLQLQSGILTYNGKNLVQFFLFYEQKMSLMDFKLPNYYDLPVNDDFVNKYCTDKDRQFFFRANLRTLKRALTLYKFGSEFMFPGHDGLFVLPVKQTDLKLILHRDCYNRKNHDCHGLSCFVAISNKRGVLSMQLNNGICIKFRKTVMTHICKLILHQLKSQNELNLKKYFIDLLNDIYHVCKVQSFSQLYKQQEKSKSKSKDNGKRKKSGPPFDEQFLKKYNINSNETMYKCGGSIINDKKWSNVFS